MVDEIEMPGNMGEGVSEEEGEEGGGEVSGPAVARDDEEEGQDEAVDDPDHVDVSDGVSLEDAEEGGGGEDPEEERDQIELCSVLLHPLKIEYAFEHSLDGPFLQEFWSSMAAIEGLMV